MQHPIQAWKPGININLPQDVLHNSGWDVGTLYGRPKDVWCYLGFREVMDKKAGQTIFCLTTSIFSNSIDYRLDTPISSVVRNKQRHISLDNSKSLDLHKTISSIDHAHFFSKWLVFKCSKWFNFLKILPIAFYLRHLSFAEFFEWNYRNLSWDQFKHHLHLGNI